MRGKERRKAAAVERSRRASDSRKREVARRTSRNVRRRVANGKRSDAARMKYFAEMGPAVFVDQYRLETPCAAMTITIESAPFDTEPNDTIQSTGGVQ